MATISVSLPSDGETIDAADYNTPINTIVTAINGNLDNSNIAANAAISGSKLADGGVTASKLATGGTAATVATSETTTSTSFADLTTTTDTVTATVGANGLALVNIYSSISNSTINAKGFVGFAISGATTQAAADNFSVELQGYAANAEGRKGCSFLLTGLTPGSTTFKMKYKVETGGSGAGTGTFKDRRISVVPL